MSNELIEAMARAMDSALAFEVEGDVRAGELTHEERCAVAKAAYAAIADRVVVKGSVEPVAWLYREGETLYDVYTNPRPGLVAGGLTEIPLYAHPPKVDLAGVDELVGRLREQRPEGEPISVARLMDAAADTIQSLAAQLAEARAENARLREAAGNNVGPDDPAQCPGQHGVSCCGWHDTCRAALEQGEAK